MMKKGNYVMDKNTKNMQAVMYASNAIVDILGRIDKNVIAVSSSTKYRDTKSFIMYRIAEEISKLDKNTALIEVDFSDGLKEEDEMDSKGNLYKRTIINPDIKKFKLIMDELKSKYDVIIVNIPPVRLFANALQYTKICENVILLEKYLYTRYKAFEETLDLLKRNDVNVSGVIACK